MRDIVTTISGTGQVSASNQIDLKSKVSGDIIYLNNQANGTQITKGTLITKIDARNTEIALENARIAYEKLTRTADQSTLLQSQSNLNDAVSTNIKSYEDGFNYITTTLIDIPTIINGLDTLLYNQTGYLESERIRQISQAALDLKNKAGISFDIAKNNYNNLQNQYKNFSRSSSTSTIESFVSDTYNLTREIAEVLKNTQNAIDFVRKQKSDTSGDATAENVSTWTKTINTDLANLLNAKTSIKSSFQNILQKTIDLNKVIIGADDLDIQSQRLSLKQKEYEYSDYFIRAPFDGVLARLSVKSTDTVGNGTIIGTIVSDQKISNITLNEVDVVKVKVGQKVKLTFDAIDGKTLSKINYVELFSGSTTTPPIQRNIKTGISNDLYTEIISGINDGDRIVIRTITFTIAKVTTPSILGTAGGNRTGTASTVRIPRN